MATKTGVVIADFTTNLATAIAVGGTTATLQSATDDDGVALAAGQYYFTIDGENSSKEHFQCQLSGTALTALYSCSRQGVLTSGAVRAHRIGATVSLTDFAHLRYISQLISGATTLNSSVPLGYDGAPSITTGNQLATKTYVDGVAVAGASNMDLTTKGIGEEATSAEINAGTQTGSTGAELVVNPSYLAASNYFTFLPTTTQKDALVGTGTPSTSNKYATADTVTTSLAALVPAGSIQMYAGSAAPTGWLLCDGTAVSRATYATLFAITSTTYGVGDGSTTFNTPDLRGRVPIGVGTGTGGGASGTGAPTGGDALTAVARATWKGEQTHVLTIGELAAHTHVQTIGKNPGSGSGNEGATTVSSGATLTSGSAGSDTAHNNIQPVMGVNFIIKT